MDDHMNSHGDGRSPTALALREVFPPPSLEDWRAECQRLLKDVPFEKRMLTATYEGITVEPLYTRTTLAGLAHGDGLPGFAPFLRGARPLGYIDRPWEVAQELPYAEIDRFNAALRHDLDRGQTAVVLTIDQAGRAGLDPDEARHEQVGKEGISVASLRDLAAALDGVDLARVPVHIDGGPAALFYAALLVGLAEQRGVAPAHLRGSVGWDPIAHLAGHGALPLALDQAYDELAALTAWAADHAPGLQSVAVRGHVYHDAGSTVVQDLAFMLAVGVHHLRELERRGLDVQTAAPRIRYHASIGADFFMEIARLRAARFLWARLVEEAGGDEKARRLAITARTSRFTKTILDPHGNILRATTEAMAAILGQVDALHVAPFDEPLGLPDEFSRRLARNTQIILREESCLDRVADPAGGSWYVEKLTSDLAAAAWRQFQAIEAAGGVVQALQNGALQQEVAAVAAARRRSLAVRKDVLVGVNQYPDARQKLLSPRGIDHAALHAKRSLDLQEQRMRCPDARQALATTQRTGTADGQGSQLLRTLVDAAAKGATVGEMRRALWQDAGPSPSVEPLAAWRAGAMYERLRLAVQAHADRAATTVFCANLGDPARYMPRLDFVRGFFQVGGFAVEADRWFASPVEVGEAAMQTVAATAVIVGLDVTYSAQAAATARELQDAGIETVILAGQPADLVDELKAAGVDAFIHARCDAHAVLSELAASKGVSL